VLAQTASGVAEPVSGQERRAYKLPEQSQQELIRLLDAYFDVGNALAADTAENISEPAHLIESSISSSAQVPPADSPHFWHSNDEDVQTIREQARVLGEASELHPARIAYGVMSGAMNRLISSTGVPPKYGKDIFGFVCGMFQDVPQNGSWLQIGNDARNPYFGSSMPKCHSMMFEVPGPAKTGGEHANPGDQMELHDEHQHL